MASLEGCSANNPPALAETFDAAGMQMGDFELYAQRSIKGASGGSSAASSSAASPVNTSYSSPSAGTLSPSQNMGQPQAPPPNPTQSVMTVDEEVDESMIFIESPKVRSPE